MKKEKLKIVDFKNIPSSLKNFKEIVVTYNEDGELKRYYAFVDKNEKNPINAAKKEFEAAIKRGNAFKKDKIQSPSTKKNPFMVATLGIVSALALTMTGLFVWKAVTVAPSGGGGGDTPEPVPPEPTPDEPGDPSKPLTFVSHTDGGSINFIYESYNGASVPQRNIELEYQIDDGVWTKVDGLHQLRSSTSSDSYTIEIVSGLKKDQEVHFRGDNVYWSYIAYDTGEDIDWDFDELLSLTAEGDFSVKNNIMSLVSKENYERVTNSTPGCFAYAFSPYSTSFHFISDIHDATKLIFPKLDTLPAYYFYSLFYCSNLRFAPQEIVSETVALGYCSLADMFYFCQQLETPPSKIGGKEAKISECSCWRMFFACENLRKAPELPITKMAPGCYASMFEDCVSLKEAPDLPATALDIACYSGYSWGEPSGGGMFANCSSLIKAPRILPATELEKNCYASMFLNCTSLTQAPELPATTLEENCYYSMFSGCGKLNELKVGFDDSGIDGWPSDNSTIYWLQGAGAAIESTSPTFYWKGGDGGTEIAYRGDGTVPENWVIYHYE